MGRPKKSPLADVEPEDVSHDIPDEEPDPMLEPDPVLELDSDDEPTTANGRSVNQAELVRKAVAAGHEKPKTGVPYIKAEFGVDIDPRYYSVAKGNMRKQEGGEAPEPVKRGRKPKVVVPGYVAPPEKPKVAGEPDLLMALEGVKALVGQFGADRVKKMIDILS